MSQKDVILSGIRPTGKLHIGNYLGALKNFVDLQNQYTCYFFIADLHSLNEKYDPREKYHQILEQTAEFLAAGLNPDQCTIFLQSRLHEHSELAIILSNVIPVSYLFRMTQFKEKSAELGKKSVNAGLLYYPVLMAADILIYKPSRIPVGDDQTQHVELARDVARFFNKAYGETFPEPKPLHTDTPRVMSIVNPDKKMSKSLGNEHCIYLDDSKDVILKKLAKSPTDTGDGKSAGAKNLLELAKLFCPETVYKKFLSDKQGGKIHYAELKKTLAENISGHFSEFRKKKHEYMKSPREMEQVLAKGEQKARITAHKTLLEVKKRVGIVP